MIDRRLSNLPQKAKDSFLLFYQKITQKFKPPVKHFHAQAHPTSKKSRKNLKVVTTPTTPIKHFTPLYSLTNSKTNKINITKPTPL